MRGVKEEGSKKNDGVDETEKGKCIKKTEKDCEWLE